MNSPATALLEIDQLSVRRGDVMAVERVSLRVDEGAFFVLVGPSGCGKTSLLRAVAGFERPAAGSVRLDGRLLAGGGVFLPPEKRAVGMVFQDGALFPHLTVEHNVAYGVARRPDRSERVETVLDLVGLSGYGERYPDELSGGERQRVALARALAPSPALLLLDEPFANLDAALRQRVRLEVKAILERAGATAVLVTHDQEEALSLADRVAVMAAGRILQEGTPQQIYHAPLSLGVSRIVGDGQIVECRIADGRAHHPLGETPTTLPDGEGRVLLRPEQLRLVGPGEGTAGRVLRRSFYGHDLIHLVELEGGPSLAVRSLAGDEAAIGERVFVAVAPGDLPVYPVPAGEESAAQ